MSETTKAVFKVHIRAPVQVVWDVLTAKGKVLRFFFGWVLDTPGLEPGAPIRMRTAGGKYTFVAGEVLEFDPPRRYSYTFRFTNLDDPPCKVTYELNEVEGGVDFTLIADDMPAGTKTEKRLAQWGDSGPERLVYRGWPWGDFLTKTLKGLIETGKPPLRSRIILALARLLEPFTPKWSRSEKWPFEVKV